MPDSDFPQLQTVIIAFSGGDSKSYYPNARPKSSQGAVLSLIRADRRIRRIYAEFRVGPSKLGEIEATT